jgi:hypothetical protein
MGWIAALIALPLVGVERHAPSGDVRRDQFHAGPPIGLVSGPGLLLAYVPPCHADDGREIVGISPVSFARVSAPTGWVCRVRVKRALFPPRFGRARRPQRLSHASQRGAVSFRWPWIRCRRVYSCFRGSPSSRARRVVGSPLAISRSGSTSVARRCRVFSKTVPISKV